METNADDTLIKMEVIGFNEGFETDGCQGFELDHFAFDEREDACTQTEAYTACKPVAPREVSEIEACQMELVESAEAAMSFFESQYQTSPTNQRKTGQLLRNKTPKTAKMLKEKHRENERLRHHSLNEHLRLICKKVPGSAEDGKETKVVMMQRIISYVAYLENTIKFISSQLDIPPEPSWQLLTSSVKDIENSGSWRKEFTAASSEESRDSDNFSSKISHRLKLSSPTIDSTTDLVSTETTVGLKAQKVKQETFAQESQDSTVPTSSYYMDIDEELNDGCQEWLVPSAEVVIDGCENFETVLNNTDFNHSMFEVPSSTFETKLMETPEKVEWLGSPDKSPCLLQEKHEKHFGIKCDSEYVEEQTYDISQIVSPDQVMPQTTVKQEQFWGNCEVTENVAVHSTSVSLPEQTEALVYNLGSPFALTMHSPSKAVPRNSKRKQSSPRRAPLMNITNWTDVQNEFSCELQDEGGLLQDAGTAPASVVGNYIEVESSPNPKVTVKEEMTEEPEDEIPTKQLAEECQRVLREAGTETTSKLDLRKSSWMNGFMMFSRIHRKKFIRENPGLHTSNISKMMGHAWREMTHEQQQPYKEQAKICSQELQRMLDQSCTVSL